METAKLKTLRSRIISLNLESFSLIELEDKIKNNLLKEKITFELNLNIEVSAHDKQVKLKNKVDIFTDNSKEIHLGTIVCVATFEIENFSEVIIDKVGVPPAVFQIFLSVLIGGTRGMYLLKVKDTFLENVMMPMIDLKTLTEQLPAQS